MPVSLRPNLFVIGSMKSGTTYLRGLLAAHPAIFMSSPKEPCRFVDPNVLRKEWPWPWEQGYCCSEERYLDLFSASGDTAILGEASTVYSQAPLYTGVPQRILACWTVSGARRRSAASRPWCRPRCASSAPHWSPRTA